MRGVLNAPIMRFFYKYRMWRPLHSLSTTLSHWSSRSTVCFLPRGAAFCTWGAHVHFWNWDLLLAMSHYIVDPNVIL